MVGSRSAIEWIVDRYYVRTDKASRIVNYPNDRSHEIGEPRPADTKAKPDILVKYLGAHGFLRLAEAGILMRMHVGPDDDEDIQAERLPRFVGEVLGQLEPGSVDRRGNKVAATTGSGRRFPVIERQFDGSGGQ